MEQPVLTWRTPPELLDPIRSFLGAIDLDPCGHPASLVRATRQILPPESGLDAQWAGRVFCNPPYSDPKPWVSKCAIFGLGPGEVVALLKLDPSTSWWPPCWWGSVVFLAKRVRYVGPEGQGNSANFPSALVYWGRRHSEVRSHLAHLGRVVSPIPLRRA